MCCRAAARARKARSEKNARPEFIHQRFWSKVDKRGPYECWPWIAGLAGRGYGAFRVGAHKVQAHRYAWQLINGKTIPKELKACHHCDNPPCCNPSHIFIGTDKDNTQDSIRKGRFHISKGEEHGMSKLTDDKVIQIRRRYQTENKTYSDLSKDYGVSATMIGDIVSGHCWKHLTGGISIARRAEGENHGHHKITCAQARTIMRRYRTRKVTMQSLADRFGINISCIFDIIHRNSWKHIT